VALCLLRSAIDTLSNVEVVSKDVLREQTAIPTLMMLFIVMDSEPTDVQDEPLAET